jgi:hypothetical protein
MKEPCEHFTVAELRSIWAYNPETGVFTWKKRGRGRQHGKRAGAFDGRYYVLEYLGIKILAHRAAWAMYYGQWPKSRLDHRDRNTQHNWISNLREATHAQNMVNKPANKHSKTGEKGVYRDKRDGRFYPYIDFEGKRKGLGGYDTLAEAVTARRAAEEAHYGEFAYHLSAPPLGRKPITDVPNSRKAIKVRAGAGDTDQTAAKAR